MSQRAPAAPGTVMAAERARAHYGVRVSSEQVYAGVFGTILGIALLVAAIRWMFGKR
ncbi:hypothetical protein GCM10028775_69000 [Catellatospora paridis]